MTRMQRFSGFAALIAAAGFCGALATPALAQADKLAFQNAAVLPPPNTWTGPAFQLSRNYPAPLPSSVECTDCTWLKAPVSFVQHFPPPAGNQWAAGKWDGYLKQVLAYVMEGQDKTIGYPPGVLNSVVGKTPAIQPPVDGKIPGFQINVKGKTRWFNVPWMAYDLTAGREFIRGTTNERTSHLTDLITPQDKKLKIAKPSHAVGLLPGMTKDCKDKYGTAGFETWSVGYYNDWGGQAIGQAIPKTGVPKVVDNLGTQMPAGLPFPQGTVVVKFLTTNAPVDCVPYLTGSPEWLIDRHVFDEKSTPNKYVCVRQPQISRIVQVDVAVTDARSPTGWVYGTYAYDAAYNAGLPDQPPTFWDHLLPLGIQYGSDPWTFPAVPQAESLPAQQSVLNPNVNIFEHFGCNNRLAGPVDNGKSSCMSCHGSAFAAPKGVVSTMGVNVPPSFGFDGLCTNYSALNAAYFNNIITPQKFSGGNYPDALPLDTSLQLEVAFIQYGQFNTSKAPAACTLDQAN